MSAVATGGDPIILRLMNRLTGTAVLLAGLLAAGVVAGAREQEPIIGGPTEDGEAVFVGLPEKPASRSRIAPADEPGEPMRIEGVVRDQQGRSVAGVIIYAYHTNKGGRYPRHSNTRDTSAARHGRLRGWAASDAEGRYAFETIRPGGYPFSRDPEHVHMHVIEPGRCTYYIDDILFDDDPRLTPEKRQRLLRGRGGNGLAAPAKDAAGRWLVRRDIVLGTNVPGYPTRD